MLKRLMLCRQVALAASSQRRRQRTRRRRRGAPTLSRTPGRFPPASLQRASARASPSSSASAPTACWRTVAPPATPLAASHAPPALAPTAPQVGARPQCKLHGASAHHGWCLCSSPKPAQVYREAPCSRVRLVSHARLVGRVLIRVCSPQSSWRAAARRSWETLATSGRRRGACLSRAALAPHRGRPRWVYHRGCRCRPPRPCRCPAPVLQASRGT